MLGSLDTVAAARGTPAEAVARIRAYLTDVADFLVNTTDGRQHEGPAERAQIIGRADDLGSIQNNAPATGPGCTGQPRPGRQQ